MNDHSKEAFLKRYAARGGFGRALGVTSAALFHAYCIADFSNRHTLIFQIIQGAIDYGHNVIGWEKDSLEAVREALELAAYRACPAYRRPAATEK